jgi:U32 family peptidase
MAWQSPVTPSVPELLAPAGDWGCAKAAVANGADAIYFGLDTGFNARARATSFSPQDLPELLTFLHRHGVAGYVTVNILAFSRELESLEGTVRQIAEAGADAVLVQDLGLVRLIRRAAPDLAIHASTQMSLTSAECINKVRELGIERVVLPRELSVREIARIHQGTTVGLEVFVHGALCVAYSGQCLTSESLGGRSANRGQCAQACRLPYELICDGREVDLGERKYLLSPQDLAAYALIPELMEAGAAAFKIEGRLKTAEYVANITRHYRRAIDAAKAGRPVEFSPRQVEEMELSFSRGFSVGWLHGCDHQALVPGLSSAKRGVLVGTVRDARRGRLRVVLQRGLKAGDGLVLEGDRAAGQEQGGRVHRLFQQGRPVSGEVEHGLVEIAFHDHAVDLQRVWAGQQVWKNDDPALTRRLRKTFAREFSGRDLPVRLEVTAAVGEPLRVRAQVSGLPTVSCVGSEPLANALKHPLTAEVLEKQLGRLGGTGFSLNRIQATITGTPMVPLSMLGQLRRDLVTQLTAAREVALHPPREVSSEPVLLALRRDIVPAPAQLPPPQLHLLCRTLAQLQVLLQEGQRHVYADFADIREYRQAVALARAAEAQILLATPRIQKPGEMGIFHALARHPADGILVRNLAGLDFFTRREIPCVTDYSLNAANELTVDYLRQQGATRVTASYDLNRDQLIDMARHSRVDLLEVVIHQHMPMFHMEHCVFCAVLSPGTNRTNCGRPCDDHVVRLRDRAGSLHTLTADVGCRNTLFNGIAQSGAEAVEQLLRLGVRAFRVEFLDEQDPARLRRCVELYRELIAGRISGREVWTALQAVNRAGVTRGTLEHRRDPLAIL